MNPFALLNGLLLVSALLCTSCDSGQTTSGQSPDAAPVNAAPAMRVEYWPADRAVSVADTVIKQVYRLRWTTTSLNDNAVLDTVQDETGKLVIAAHNRQTKLQAWKNKQLLFTTTLTKHLLGKTPQLASYAWHNIQYQGYRNQEFIFRAWVSIPDSDIGEQAEIGVAESGASRLIRMIEE